MRAPPQFTNGNGEREGDEVLGELDGVAVEGDLDGENVGGRVGDVEGVREGDRDGELVVGDIVVGDNVGNVGDVVVGDAVVDGVASTCLTAKNVKQTQKTQNPQ